MTNYLVCATHRSGSKLLCEGLLLTRLCGYPREYFSPKHSVKLFEQGAVSVDPKKDFPGYVKEVLRERRRSNGVFGAKLMWPHVRTFSTSMGMDIAGRDYEAFYRALDSTLSPSAWIWLRREDKVRQAISMVKAKRTKQFTKTSNQDEPSAEFDYEAVDEQVQRFEKEEEHWRLIFEAGSVRPLTLVFEEFIENYERDIVRAAEHIGIDTNSLSVKNPRHHRERQSNSVTEEWVRKYNEVRSA